MSQRLYVGTRKGLFTVERNGTGSCPWTVTDTEFLGAPVSFVRPVGPERVHVALNHGHFGVKMHRSLDGGARWEETAAPVYPEKPADLVEASDEGGGKSIPWALKDVWSIEAGTPDQPDRLWCGTLPGGLFRSDDRGESWELVRSLWDHPARAKWFGGGSDYPAIHSVCVDPRDGKRVAIGVSCAGVWRTDDDGETWHQSAHGMRAEYMPPDKALEPDVQDPHCIVQCPSSPDDWWCQHHNGIFKSHDDGRNWTEITDVPPSTFGFPVAVHPKDPKSAWFVPATKDDARFPSGGRVLVNRTRDGGETFEALRNGLPQEHAYDIVFRHALDIDGSGDVLAMGSTTGSLWITEDGGDSWVKVSGHLPPVYCLRFRD